MKGNILGDSFDKYVKEQIKVRQEIYGSKQRTPQQLSYLNGKQAFVRLVSSVDIVGEEGKEKLKQFGFPNPDLYMGSQLAKNFILHAGTTVYDEFGVPSKESLRKGVNFTNDPYPINSVYGIGGTEFGLQPMPTLGDVEVKYRNRGSLREANLTIKCFNPKQFEIIDTLYLRLGYTLLLEWGNSIYFNNQGEYVSNNFLNSLQGYMFDETNKDDQLKLLQSIEKLRFDSSGNYDALFGKVANYNWNFENGVYNINLKLISLGDIIESLLIKSISSKNKAKNPQIPKSNTELSFLDIYKNHNDLTLLLFTAGSSPFDFNQGRIDEETQEIITAGNTPSQIDITGGNNPSLQVEIEIIGGDTTADQTREITRKREIDIKKVQDEIGTPSPEFSSLKDIAIEAGFDSTFEFGKILRQDKINNNIVELNISEADKSIMRVNRTLNTGDGTLVSDPLVYIRFSALLEFLEKTQMIYNPKQKDNSSLLFIDYNIDTNYMVSSKLVVSSNPNICIVNVGSILDDEFFGLNSPVTPGTTVYLPQFKEEIGGETAGKIMNIYLNARYLTNLLISLEGNEGEIPVFNFLNQICKDVNNSLGNLSSIAPFLDESTNTLKIIEEGVLPNKNSILKTKFNEDITLTSLELFGYNNIKSETPSASFVKNFGIKTEITNNLATIITIGAQNKGLNAKYDGTSFSNWNRGLEDRLVSIKDIEPTLVQEESISLEEKYNIQITGYKELLKETENRGFTEENVGAFKTALQGVLKYNQEIVLKEKEKPVTSPGFLPLNLNLTLDGFSGIKIYQSFNTISKFLPYPFPESLEFLIKGLAHKISNNTWVTIIDSLSIPVSDEVRIDPKSTPIKTNSSTPPPVPSEIFTQPTAADTIIKNQSSTNTERKPIEDINVEDGIALDIIKAFESFRAFPYLDDGNPSIWTIGYGTIKINGKSVTENTPPVSTLEATQYLLNDVQIFVNALQRGLRGLTFTQNEFDALLSLTYNVGPAWTSSSSSNMRKLLFNGNYTAAADEIRTWKWTGGKVNQGLVNRREAERTLFLTNFPGNPS